MIIMNASKLQREGREVFEAVEATGCVEISNTQRETMYLMSKEQLNKILRSATQREVFIDFAEE